MLNKNTGYNFYHKYEMISGQILREKKIKCCYSAWKYDNFRGRRMVKEYSILLLTIT